MSRRKKDLRKQPAKAPAPDVRLTAEPTPQEVRWAFPLAVFAIALALRGIYLWQLHSAPFFDLRFGDGQAYHAWARRIAGGDWMAGGVFYQAPLYPHFLAVVYWLLGDGVLLVRVIQAILGSVSCALLSAAGISLFGRWGASAGLLLAVYPPAIFLDSQIEKTALISVLTSALVALLSTRPDRMTARRWAGLGILLGLLTLARENALVLAAPVLLWMAWGPFQGTLRQRLRPALFLAAGVGLVLLPAGLRNLAAGGEFHLTTSQFGPNFYIGNNPTATGLYQPLVAGHGNVSNERDDAARLAEEAEGRKMSPSEVSGFWTSRAVQFIGSQPGAWMKLSLRKLAMTINAAEVSDTECQEVHAEWSSILRLLRPLSFGALLGLALFGAALTWRLRSNLWFLYALAAFYASSVALFYVFARYRFPLACFLAIPAAGGIAELVRRGKELNLKRLAAAAAAAIAGMAAAFLPLVDASTGRAVHYLAVAHELSQRPERTEPAIEYFERALNEDPQWPPARFGLGLFLNRSGRPAEAIPHLLAALAVWPDYAEARYSLSEALRATGRHSDAQREYLRALGAGGPAPLHPGQ